MKDNVLHLESHFALSSALAAGYGIVLIALATGPIWSGNAWGWKVALITGLAPAAGITLALLYYPLDHLRRLSRVRLLGTFLAWRSGGEA